MCLTAAAARTEADWDSPERDNVSRPSALSASPLVSLSSSCRGCDRPVKGTFLERPEDVGWGDRRAVSNGLVFVDDTDELTGDRDGPRASVVTARCDAKVFGAAEVRAEAEIEGSLVLSGATKWSWRSSISSLRPCALKFPCSVVVVTEDEVGTVVVVTVEPIGAAAAEVDARAVVLPPS